MDVFYYNISWIAFNLYLALLPVLFAALFFAFRNKILKGIFFILWILYLPNSIYVITDTLHMLEQWDIVDMVGKLVLLIQYFILEFVGLAAFIFALYPFERLLRKSRRIKRHTTTLIVVINFLIGLGMVFGRVDRLNSWDVFTTPQAVVVSIIHVFTTVELLGLAILLGLFANLVYFLFRDLAKHYLK